MAALPELPRYSGEIVVPPQELSCDIIDPAFNTAKRIAALLRNAGQTMDYILESYGVGVDEDLSNVASGTCWIAINYFSQFGARDDGQSATRMEITYPNNDRLTMSFGSQVSYICTEIDSQFDSHTSFGVQKGRKIITIKDSVFSRPNTGTAQGRFRWGEIMKRELILTASTNDLIEEVRESIDNARSTSYQGQKLRRVAP